MRKVNILYKKPNEFPVEMIIDDELENYQELVEGYIEVFPISDNFVIVCNEEGKLRGMKENVIVNGELIVGPVIFVGANEEGDFVDCPISLEDLIRSSI